VKLVLVERHRPQLRENVFVNLRRCWRAVTLAVALTVCLLRLGLVRLRGPLSPESRASWLQFAGRTVLASLGITYSLTGEPPTRGLLVSNHLSYLDILIYTAVMPCVMVSKIEIASWPYFGMTARAGGTIFIDRSSRASTISVARQISDRLALPIPILLFPEGTSSDGSQVLPFHNSLFEPAIAAQAPVTAAAVRYVIEGDVAEKELCWYDDMLFLSHLWKALGTPGFAAEVHFGEPHIYPNRRSAAQATHTEVATLREARALVLQ
jgi:1-acyl-sn-glycerol-3-phosphate acyltransferase